MSRWEDTALLMPKIKKDPIDALIESQTDEPIATVTRQDDSADEWDDVYGEDRQEPPVTIKQEVRASGSCSNPIDLDLDDENIYPPPGSSIPNTSTNTTVKGRYEETYSTPPGYSLNDKIRSLERENAKLLEYTEQLERRIDLLETGIPGMSNHQKSYKNHGKLSATVCIDRREFVIDNLSPQMSGLEFTRRVAEVARRDPGNLIVMQHSTIQPHLPLYKHGLGERPFYAVSIGDKEVEIGRAIKIKLFGPGPLI